MLTSKLQLDYKPVQVTLQSAMYRKEHDTMEEVKRDLFEYVELFYNMKRIHRT